MTISSGSPSRHPSSSPEVASMANVSSLASLLWSLAEAFRAISTVSFSLLFPTIESMNRENAMNRISRGRRLFMKTLFLIIRGGMVLPS